LPGREHDRPMRRGEDVARRAAALIGRFRRHCKFSLTAENAKAAKNFRPLSLQFPPLRSLRSWRLKIPRPSAVNFSRRYFAPACNAASRRAGAR
jgi:hypothetical protein